ncbi:MAG: glycoside hydrolase family 20 zincin-like fold domain-containing protein [bacterium]
MVYWKKVVYQGIMIIAASIMGISMAVSVSASLPEVNASYAITPPILDGKLDDPCWQKAQPVLGFIDYQNKKPILNQTEVYVVYDSTNIYIAFRGYESKIDKLVGSYTTENEPVFLDDSFEIFISPFMVTANTNYYHFVTNVLGTKYSMFHGEERYGSPDTKLVWEVKTGKENNAWVAEFKIPFSTLKARGNNDRYWRINFARNEMPNSETSSWSFCDGSFHNYDRFGILKGIEFDGKFITYRGELEPLKPTTTIALPPLSIPDAMVSQPKPVVVIPQPVYLKLLDQDLPIDKTTKIVIASKPSRENAKAAQELQQEIEEIAGVKVAIIPANKLKSGTVANAIVIGEPWVNPVSKKVCNLEKIEVNKTYPGEQGYVLRVTGNYAIIAGSDPIGTYYGVQSFKQLLRINSESAFVAKGAEIYDKPQFKYRSIHLLADKDSIWFHTRLIERVLARYKINQILYEVEQGMEWKSVPEINNPNMISQTDFKKVLKCAKDHFIAVTPLVQTLGHLEFVFRNNKKNMVFVEDSSYPYAYCPLNPKSYEFAYKMLDEAIAVFDHPEYVHIGHDEFEMRGTFPVHEECKKIGIVDLYYMDTLKLYEHLKQKGVKTVMWGDILYKDKYQAKIDSLPKDILIADWRYSPRTEYPSIDFFQAHGFKTLGCTWYIPKNIEGFSQYCAKKNSYGMMQTTWTGYFGNKTAMEKEFQQIYAYILAVDYFWSPLPKKLGELPYDPAQILLDRWEEPTMQMHPKPGLLFNLSSYSNLSLIDTKDTLGFLGFGSGNDLSGLANLGQPGPMRLSDSIQYTLSQVGQVPAGIMLKGPGMADIFPKAVSGISINQKLNSISFLHTTGWTSKSGNKVGQYIIHYTDGTLMSIDLVYGINIHAWQDTVSTPAQVLAWKGKSRDGKPINLRSYRWSNPNPDKEIGSIDFVATDTTVAPILLAITGVK